MEMMELLETKNKNYDQALFKVVADAKVCLVCQRLLTFDHFSNDKSRTRDGHKTICADCMKKGIKHYDPLDHETQIIIARKYCRTNE